MKTTKISGLGLGLRFPHFEDIFLSQAKTPWFEVITDDFLNPGPHWQKLENLRTSYPINLHSIGLNIGGINPHNLKYLQKLQEIYTIFEPIWISDHLCWSAHEGKFHHDLLPIPRTKEALQHICERILFIQDYFKRPLLIENITSYIDYKSKDFSETDFIKQIIEKTGCFLLLDLTNILINFSNRTQKPHFDIDLFLLQHTKQIHLSGGSSIEIPTGKHSNHGTETQKVKIDSHSAKVEKTDIEFYQYILSLGYKIPAIIERDSALPEFEELELERQSIEQKLHPTGCVK